MDFERGGMEFTTRKPDKETFSVEEDTPKKDSGYSEEEQSKIIEGVTADMKQTPAAQNVSKRSRSMPSVSRKEKIIASYRKNIEKILQLVEAISQLEGKNYRQEEQIVEEIKHLRSLQEELLNALILEQKGLLTPESISKTAWNLIE